MSKLITPNVKKLIIHKMSVDAVPAGGGIGDALKFLTTPGSIGKGWKEAAEWIESAIMVIRQAAEPNPWKDSSDEEIAGYLLQRIEERRRKS
jgi:hypothetical protein